MRAAIYARFSTDMQRQESIADQLAACRAFCAREGLQVVASYEDAAISGASMANRPGLAELLRAARAGSYDVIVTEALDRLSRSQGDVATLYEDLRFKGVSIRTISEGEIEEMAIGLKGTMNALFLRETARKTRRGLAGVAAEGRHTGGRVYGYRIKREFDAHGQFTPGLREIDQAEAEVVREVFREYAAGRSPRAIAAMLNDRGFPAPRGGQWNASTINGNAARGNGLLHNQLYRGLMVWGRQTWSKSRETGARRARTATADQQVRTEVPHLRIISDELWQAVHARYRSVSLGSQARPETSRRAVRMLSGLTRCGVCSGPLIIGGAEARLVCSTRRERGPSACTNGRGVRSAEVEARTVAAIRDLLLEPAVVEEAVREFQRQSGERKSEARQLRIKKEAELAEAKRRAAYLVDQVADGMLSGAAVREKLAALEATRERLERELAETSAPEDAISFHPSTAKRFARLVERLNEVLSTSDTLERAEAREAFRALIRRVVVTPAAERGRVEVLVETEMAALLSQDGHIVSLGAGTGFEPVTFRL